MGRVAAAGMEYCGWFVRLGSQHLEHSLENLLAMFRCGMGSVCVLSRRVTRHQTLKRLEVQEHSLEEVIK